MARNHLKTSCSSLVISTLEVKGQTLGMRILGVVEISELGTSAGLTMSTLAMGGIRPLSASSDSSGELSVEPGEIDVSARVDVIFSAE